MFLRRGPSHRVRRSGIVAEGSIARTICAYCAGTDRGRTTDDGSDLAVAVRLDCSIPSGLFNFGRDIVIVALHFEWGLHPFIVDDA